MADSIEAADDIVTAMGGFDFGVSSSVQLYPDPRRKHTEISDGLKCDVYPMGSVSTRQGGRFQTDIRVRIAVQYKLPKGEEPDWRALLRMPDKVRDYLMQASNADEVVVETQYDVDSYAKGEVIFVLDAIYETHEAIRR